LMGGGGYKGVYKPNSRGMRRWTEAPCTVSSPKNTCVRLSFTFAKFWSFFYW